MGISASTLKGEGMAIRHYIGIAEPGPQNWSISFPAFPGTITTGDNFAGLMQNARDALASVVEAMQEDGQTIPDSFEAFGTATPDMRTSDYQNPHIVLVPVDIGGRSLRINVTMDEGMVARLDRVADRVESSRSALLARGARMVLAAEAAEMDN